MSDAHGMQCDAIQGQSQGQEPFKFGNPTVFKSYLLRHLQWRLTSDHGFLNYKAQHLNLVEPDF